MFVRFAELNLYRGGLSFTSILRPDSEVADEKNSTPQSLENS